VHLDEWIIMPNHLHGIIVINNSRGASGRAQSQTKETCKGGSRTAPTKIKPLGQLIGAFKTMSTKRVNELRNTPGASIWQRNYYERIIRDEDELTSIRHYIYNNPACWSDDNENPANRT
jgi:REP element-mobilizing transposase RayT